MARDVRGAAAQAAEDDFYGPEDGEIEGVGGDEGQGGGWQGQQGTGSSEGSADDLGEEQEAGGGEDLDSEPDDDELLGLTPPRRQTRGESRQQRLANENRRQAERIAELERVQRQPAQTFQPTGPQEETDQQFEARVRELPPDERMEQRHLRWQGQTSRQRLIDQVQAAELADRTAFNAKVDRDPRYARWADRVEEEIGKLRQQGQIVSRENVLYYLVGKHVLSREGSKGVKRARAAAQERVNRQTVRPSQAGSDVRQERRGRLSERDARARRLEGVQI